MKILKIVVLMIVYISYKSIMPKILYNLIRFVRDNKHILDRFYYENFNLFKFCSITYANPIYDKKFCLLIICLFDNHSRLDLYYLISK